MIKIIFFILLIIAGATFATLNRQEISLHYFWGWNTGSFPLFIFILSSLLIGMVLGFSYRFRKRWELRAQARDLGKKVKSLREDLQQLNRKEETPVVTPPSPEAGKPPFG